MVFFTFFKFYKLYQIAPSITIYIFIFENRNIDESCISYIKDTTSEIFCKTLLTVCLEQYMGQSI